MELSLILPTIIEIVFDISLFNENVTKASFQHIMTTIEIPHEKQLFNDMLYVHIVVLPTKKELF